MGLKKLIDIGYWKKIQRGLDNNKTKIQYDTST